MSGSGRYDWCILEMRDKAKGKIYEVSFGISIIDRDSCVLFYNCIALNTSLRQWSMYWEAAPLFRHFSKGDATSRQYKNNRPGLSDKIIASAGKIDMKMK